MIAAIVAIAENFAIGRNGKLPWHYSPDLKFFKQTTLNQTVVMGFNTWKSIGKVLPNRLNIVLSRANEIESQPSLLLLRSVEETLSLTKYLHGDLYVIGGAEIYKSFSAVIEKWIVTRVPETIADADAFMPRGFLDDFKITAEIQLAENLKVEIYEK